MTMMMMVLLVQALTEAQQELSGGAFAFMLLSMGAVTVLTAWCFTRVLITRKHFDPDGTGPAKPPVRGEAETP